MKQVKQALQKYAPWLSLKGLYKERGVKENRPINSNSWVIGGMWTDTGKPYMANDPHLSFSAPMLWYYNHLQTNDGSVNITGVSIAGIPFVVIGKNSRIGWSLTDSGAGNSKNLP